MKKLYLIITISLILNLSNKLFAQLPSGYCTSGVTQTDDEDISKVVLSTIDNSTTCSSLSGSQGTGSGTASLYTNFHNTSVPLPVITPGTSFNLAVSIFPCDGIIFTGGAKAWIDYNRSGTFEATEGFVIGTTTFTATTTPVVLNTNFTLPIVYSTGETKMRIKFSEETAANIPPCGSSNAGGGTFTWGETEDYSIFLGIKKWDYSMSSMIAPDSISFCADQPQSPEVSFRNVENQPINGGRVDLYITDPANPTTGTNIFASKAFTSTVMPNTNSSVVFDPIVFPKDEVLQFMYVIYHPLDSVEGNDTLYRMVQIYKKPQFSLKADTVCHKDFKNKAIIFNQTKPLFQKWGNEAITDTTTFLMPNDYVNGVIKPYKFPIFVSRGWKCNLDTFVNLIVYPQPLAFINGQSKFLYSHPDTITLCKGQTGKLSTVFIETGYNFKWDDDLSSQTPEIQVNDTVTRSYTMAITSKDQCVRKDTFIVKVVSPPLQTRINDTICLGDIATVGISNSNPIDFLYNWNNKWGTEPVLNPSPTGPGNYRYICRWNYQGCLEEDTVRLLVRPLPNVITTAPVPICPFFSTTILASGANTYEWKNGYGTNPNITVSPLTSTIYTVKGTDNNLCSKEVSYKLFVYPRTDVNVYSNKFQNNVCLGDSATVYVNGAKNYIWNTGSTDSIISLVPQSSFQWSVIGTDENGCKDTTLIGLTVKPAFKPTILSSIIGCEGDSKKLVLTGGKKYDWGSYGTDSFADIVLAKTTSYLVTVTSPEDCQMIQAVPVTVLKAPVAQVSDLTICKDETGKLEAKGGSSYIWSTSGNTSALETISLSSSQDVTVTVTNEAGCTSSATTSVKVIVPDSVSVVFKSPLDSYICPSARIPITMTATPTGGVWSGTGVTGYKLTIPENVSGPIQINYEFFEPVNGCKVSRVKNVNIIRKCNSSINGFDEENSWSVYPNPFTNQLKLKVESLKSEYASINIYDLAGRLVITKDYKLTMGENILELNSLQLSRGTYYIELQTESVSRQAKILAE